MKLALMQPYFFPYIGYYAVMKHVDYYVYFDTAQYIKGGWINRNRILKPDGKDWQYITIPIKKHSTATNINDIYVDLDSTVINRILNQLAHYKKNAPYYENVIDIVKKSLQRSKKISEINIFADKMVCSYLGICEPKYVLSKDEIAYVEASVADEWGLNVCLSFSGVNEYWNAPGGKAFFDSDKYNRYGIEIRFVKTNLRSYKQKIAGNFISSLSILDVMMFNSPNEINEMLDDFTFL